MGEWRKILIKKSEFQLLLIRTRKNEENCSKLFFQLIYFIIDFVIIIDFLELLILMKKAH